MKSVPKLIQIEDFNDDGDIVQLRLNCLELPDSQKNRKKRKKKKKKKEKKKHKNKLKKLGGDKYDIWFRDYQRYDECKFQQV